MLKFRKDGSDKAEAQDALTGVQHDVLVGGVTLAAILLLVGTGTTWIQSLSGLTDHVRASESAIAGTLLLNIALILFGWRRFRELRQEVARRTLAEELARKLASCDPLTGMLNRRALVEEGQSQIERWRKAGKAVAALVVDIDSFKSINDLFGHAGGDIVIKASADRLRLHAPDDSIVARLGGDEFALLFALDYGQDGQLDLVGEAVTAALAESVLIEDVHAPTSSSVGGALALDPSMSLETLLRRADLAMYRAKKLGRCRFCAFDDSMEVALAKRDVIEREMRIAITAGDIFPVYEPLIDLSTNQPIGYEMLARWKSDVLGQVVPSDFIPIAEETGLISSLSDLLFRQAFRDACAWPADLFLSVNVSPLQLRDPWFAQKLLKLLAETGLPGQRLVVEVTESAIIDNIPLAQTVFASLRNQGIRMALDDFGTGYSSIASLRALPFDSVKIDREFISRMTQSDGKDSIAEAVLQLGRSLGLPVVAEGIESSETALWLSSINCAIGQGHYYGEALSHDMIRQRHGAGGRDTRRRA